MVLRSVNIDSITEKDLRSLVDNEVAELRVIEYKRELPGTTDSHRKEFLSDVCSFANANGGDLELPPIGWQLFILGSSQSDPTPFPSFLDTYATRLLAEPLSVRG